MTVINSLRKILNGGIPPSAKAPPASSTALNGMHFSIPLTTVISRVPYFSSTLPEPQNSRVFARLWFRVCSSAARMPSGPPMPIATAISPMFSTLE
ncbi:hypothetical protein D3C80_1807180 [compost metagenome]